jgi:hypothetical protein
MPINELVPKSDEYETNTFGYHKGENYCFLVRTDHKFDCVSQTYDTFTGKSYAIHKLVSICPV